MADSTPSRRHFTRIPFHTEYRLAKCDETQLWSGEVMDLSLHGVLIERPADLQLARGDEVQLSIDLNNGELAIDMQARVAHTNDKVIGFECEYIDLDSMTHLRRLLELNLADTGLVEREIGEIIELNRH